VKPISEWTDVELESVADGFDAGLDAHPFAAEVLTVRAELAAARAREDDLVSELTRTEEQIARQRPVIDAAIAWSQDFPSASKCDGVLMRAVIAYRTGGDTDA
jgi:hypothetical protein